MCAGARLSAQIVRVFKKKKRGRDRQIEKPRLGGPG